MLIVVGIHSSRGIYLLKCSATYADPQMMLLVKIAG